MDVESSSSSSSRIHRWKKYYFIYNHRILFLAALVFCRSLANNAIVGVLIWYLTSTGDGLVKFSVSTNAHGVLSSILVIFVTYIADSPIGRFKALMFSNVSYIGALVLLWKFNPHKEIWILVVALVLLALGTSGHKILEDALLDIVNDIDKSADPDETRSIARATIWQRVTSVSGSLISLLWVAPVAIGEVHSSWELSFLIRIIIMTLAVILFGLGHVVYVYHKGELTGRHVNVFIGVFQALFKKLPKYIFGCFKIFSRLVTPSNNSDIEKGENERIKQDKTLHSENKVVLKSLLKMLPMWLVFSVVSTISATGNTFFLQQYNNLNTGNDIAVQIYTLVQAFSKYAIPFLYGRRWICCLPKNEKVKIGVGIICGVISCTFARLLELYRLKEASHLDIYTKTSISFLWLVPQFLLRKGF